MLERTRIVKETLSQMIDRREMWNADSIFTACVSGYPQLFNLKEDYEHWELVQYQNNCSAFNDAINKVIKSFKLKVTKNRNDAQLLLGLDIDTEYIQHYYYVETMEGSMYVPVEQLTEEMLINIYQNGKAKEAGQRKWNEEHKMLFKLRFGKNIEDAIKSVSSNN
jgi:hypothetical protein